MKAISLFSGIGGLDLAVAEVFGAHPVAFAELDRNAAKVLVAHWPDVPNLGDVTAVEWEAWEGVDVIHGGPPCQPFSAAGRRGGMTDDRWMWPAMERAVRVVRPRYVVVENVPPLVADDAWGVIVGDLAALGYVGSWLCLRASDVGACHRRERVFLLAADARGTGRSEATSGSPSQEGRIWSGRGHHVADRSLSPVRRHRPVVEQVAANAESHARWFSHGDGVPAADAEDERRERLGGARGRRGRPADNDREDDDAPLRRLQREGTLRAPLLEGRRGMDGGAAVSVPGVQWGAYAAAIARHAAVLGRPAPAPVDERGRLSAAFVEWMQMFPAGWVTDVLPRNPALKALGNAVVPPQGAAALRLLLARLKARQAVPA